VTEARTVTNLPNRVAGHKRAMKVADRSWPAGAPPVVSICCWSYNDAFYIRECIEGMLEQETTFPVEIIIHDDASTDGTARVIREYESAYPGLFNNILRTENQYSCGGDIQGPLLGRAVGCFIALCHGDDYWSDPTKLQTQFAFMTEHNECAMSFHPAYVVRDHEDEPVGVRNQRKKESIFLSDAEVITGMGGFFPTSAVMLRREIVLREMAAMGTVDIPGDHLFSIASLAVGKIGYIDKIMSVYRRHPKSLSQAYRHQNARAIALEFEKQYRKTIGAIDQFDRHLGRRETKLFAMCRARYTYDWAVANIALLSCRSAYQLNKPKMGDLSYRQACALYLRYVLKALRLKWRT
jgi:glycosyltransferase involved in cell wall biosynthesis